MTNNREPRRRSGQLSSIHEAGELVESKFESLAARYRFATRAYGLLEDFSLLVRDDVRTVQTRSSTTGILHRSLTWLLMLSANLLVANMLYAHLATSLSTFDLGGQVFSNDTSLKPNESAQSQRPMLREFEGVRLHASRLAAVTILLTWNLGKSSISSVFADCRLYYAIFHPIKLGSQVCRANPMDKVKHAKRSHESARDHQDSSDDDETHDSCPLNLTGRLDKISEQHSCRFERPEMSADFYGLAKRRIRLACWLPVAHLLLILAIICAFPSSKLRDPQSVRLLHPNSGANSQVYSLGRVLAQKALDNYDSFHLAIHTAFHPRDHRVKLVQSGANLTMSGANNGVQVSTGQSAVYNLLELMVYALFFHGSRNVTASCLSLVLNLHQRCLCAFNNRLLELIGRPAGRPLRNRHVIELVKCYDLLSLMHSRIEAAFKWLIIQYYALMFINCLIHIFCLTESSSVYVRRPIASYDPIATTNLSFIGLPGNGTVVDQTEPMSPNLQQLEDEASRQRSGSIPLLCLRFLSILAISYAPVLLYAEAFKIESASHRIESNLMLLTRRQHDRLAQSLEPTLFGPIYLSIGGYFNLSRRSASAYLGAIVTFSVMFIGENLLCWRPSGCLFSRSARSRCVHSNRNWLTAPLSPNDRPCTTCICH